MDDLRILAEAKPSQTERIRSFMQLPDGWHYGEGIAISNEVVEAAITADTLLLEHAANGTEAFPGVDGGILVAGYHDDDVVEVRCYPSGRMTMLHERNDNPITERAEASLDVLEAYLGDLAWTPNNSYACSILSTSAENETALQVKPSKSLLVEGGYLISRRNVRLNLAKVNAVTLTGSIRAQRAIHRFSGVSTQTDSQEAAALQMSLRQPVTPAIEIFTGYQTENAAA